MCKEARLLVDFMFISIGSIFAGSFAGTGVLIALSKEGSEFPGSILWLLLIGISLLIITKSIRELDVRLDCYIFSVLAPTICFFIGGSLTIGTIPLIALS